MLLLKSSVRATVLLFFFSSRRRHTRWPRDWSSDVCSSDLPGLDCLVAETGAPGERDCARGRGDRGVRLVALELVLGEPAERRHLTGHVARLRTDGEGR